MTLRPTTLAVTAGRPVRAVDSPVVPPVSMSVTYHADPDSTTPPGRVYARSSQPTWEALEEVIAGLEGAPGALAFASGTAAIAAAFSLLPSGGTVVLHRHLYAGSVIHIERQAAARGISVETVDLLDPTATATTIERAAARGPLLVWAESSTNPLLEVLDVPRIAATTHRAGGLLVVDNTFCTPLLVRPLDQGADVVVHSVTKFLSGHSDVIAGAAITRRDDLHAAMTDHRTDVGGILGPQEAWLALRGIRTLGVRLERAQQNAALLAQRLSEHPAVAVVHHPSLPQDPGHASAARLWNGFGAMLSLEPNGDDEDQRVRRADRAIGAARLVLSATSLGGVETSWERRHRHGEPSSVPAALVRLSVGVEDAEDLWTDLDQALRSVLPG